MIIYKKTFENIKTKNCNFPIEDQYYANNNIAIVADGITRDPIGVLDLKSINFSEFLEKYPRPSGAELAAKEIVKTFELENGTLKQKLIKCNQTVKKLNENYIKICDYLQNDYYGAVAAAALIENGYLYYSYICDCGVIVYDKKGNIKFQTIDEKEKYSDKYCNNIGIPWNLPEARVIVRREFRNNLNNIKNGRCVSYGALTGEENAVSFIRDGKIKLDEDDVVVVYSDGFSPLLKEENFINEIIKFNKISFENYIENVSKINYEKYGKEKTLVIMK